MAGAVRPPARAGGPWQSGSEDLDAQVLNASEMALVRRTDEDAEPEVQRRRRNGHVIRGDAPTRPRQIREHATSARDGSGLGDASPGGGMPRLKLGIGVLPQLEDLAEMGAGDEVAMAYRKLGNARHAPHRRAPRSCR